MTVWQVLAGLSPALLLIGALLGIYVDAKVDSARNYIDNRITSDTFTIRQLEDRAKIYLARLESIEKDIRILHKRIGDANERIAKIENRAISASK